jgi:hypothetical protein
MVVGETGILCWLVCQVRDDTGTFRELNMPVTGIQSPETTWVYTCIPIPGWSAAHSHGAAYKALKQQSCIPIPIPFLSRPAIPGPAYNPPKNNRVIPIRSLELLDNPQN